MKESASDPTHTQTNDRLTDRQIQTIRPTLPHSNLLLRLKKKTRGHRFLFFLSSYYFHHQHRHFPTFTQHSNFLVNPSSPSHKRTSAHTQFNSDARRQHPSHKTCSRSPRNKVKPRLSFFPYSILKPSYTVCTPPLFFGQWYQCQLIISLIFYNGYGNSMLISLTIIYP